MANDFYSNQIIGKMKSVGKSGEIKGAPTVASGKRSDSFYTKAPMGSGRASTTGGIPGGKNGKANIGKDTGHVSFQGSSLKRGSGHSYVTSGPLNNGD